MHKNREMGTEPFDCFFDLNAAPSNIPASLSVVEFPLFSGALDSKTLIKLKMSQLNKCGSTFFQLYYFFYPFFAFPFTK